MSQDRPVRSIAFVLAAALFAGACQPIPGAEAPMSVESCSKAKTKECVLKGMLRVVKLGDTKMGKLEIGNNQCVSVSLPPSRIEAAEKQGPHQATLQGTIFPVPTDVEVATIAVNGRKIGLGQCGSFYLFVE